MTAPGMDAQAHPAPAEPLGYLILNLFLTAIRMRKISVALSSVCSNCSAVSGRGLSNWGALPGAAAGGMQARKARLSSPWVSRMTGTLLLKARLAARSHGCAGEFAQVLCQALGGMGELRRYSAGNIASKASHAMKGRTMERPQSLAPS